MIGRLLALALVVSVPALAQGDATPRGAFYIGAGGTLSSARFGDQDVYAVGTSDVYQGSTLVSTGTAAGPATLRMGSEMVASPSVQAGTYRAFGDTAWLWGVKGSYTHLQASSTLQDVRLPQAGFFTATATGAVTPFTGNAIVRSYETEATHQVALTPYIGRSYDHGFFYLGGGPTLTELRTTLNGLVGFADINGQRSDVSGAPQNFASSGWVWGGMLTVGATYFIDASWFVDVGFTASTTAAQTGRYSSTFTNPNGANGRVTTGTLVGSSSGSLLTQGMTIVLNRAF